MLAIWMSLLIIFSAYGTGDEVITNEEKPSLFQPQPLVLLCKSRLAAYLVEERYGKKGLKIIFEHACKYDIPLLIEASFTTIQNKGGRKIANFKRCFSWFKKLKLDQEIQKKLIQYICDHSPLITAFFNEGLVRRTAKKDEIVVLIERDPNPLVWFLIENILQQRTHLVLQQRKQSKDNDKSTTKIIICPEALDLLTPIPSNIRVFLA